MPSASPKTSRYPQAASFLNETMGISKQQSESGTRFNQQPSVALETSPSRIALAVCACKVKSANQKKKKRNRSCKSNLQGNERSHCWNIQHAESLLNEKCVINNQCIAKTRINSRSEQLRPFHPSKQLQNPLDVWPCTQPNEEVTTASLLSKTPT